MTNALHAEVIGTPAVELVYDQDCPNVDECRTALREALTEIGASPAWREWDRNSTVTPAAYRRYGSPTVLVNGRDICGPGAQTTDGNSCRVYSDDERGCICGAPTVTTIVNALLNPSLEEGVVWNT